MSMFMCIPRCQYATRRIDIAGVVEAEERRVDRRERQGPITRQVGERDSGRPTEIVTQDMKVLRLLDVEQAQHVGRARGRWGGHVGRNPGR